MIKRVLSLSLAAFLIFGAIAPKQSFALDCGPYRGKVLPATDHTRNVADTAIEAIRTKSKKAFLPSKSKILLVRRFVSGEVESRGGNIWADIRADEIDSGMRIHIRAQTLIDFSLDSVFADVMTDRLVKVDRKVCLDTDRCDLLPFGDALEHLLSNLLRCNDARKGIYAFDDGTFVLDMELINEVAVGEAIFFAKKDDNLVLASLVILQ